MGARSAAKASLILCLWDLQSGLGRYGRALGSLGPGLGDPVATHVSLILTWDELIIDSSSLGAWEEASPFQPLGTYLFKGISSC